MASHTVAGGRRSTQYQSYFIVLRFGAIVHFPFENVSTTALGVGRRFELCLRTNEPDGKMVVSRAVCVEEVAVRLHFRFVAISKIPCAISFIHGECQYMAID